MTFARVVGNVVATHKKEDLRGAKLMIVQPVDNFLKDNGDEMVAIDTVGARYRRSRARDLRGLGGQNLFPDAKSTCAHRNGDRRDHRRVRY